MEKCFNCGKPGDDFFGETICDQCKLGLRLFSDATIRKQMSLNPKGYIDELNTRLEVVESEYIKSKLKLQYLLERARAMLNEE